MTAYRVIGIDPALTNVGLCVLDSEKPGDYRVTASETIKTHSGRALIERLETIHEGVKAFLSGRVASCQVVMEDPTYQRGVERSRPRNIAVMALAMGVVLGTVLAENTLQPALLGPHEWMTRVPMSKGNLTHTMPRPMLVRHLLSQIKVPAGASEHVIMAAGVARYWIEQQRHALRLRPSA